MPTLKSLAKKVFSKRSKAMIATIARMGATEVDLEIWIEAAPRRNFAGFH